MPKGGAATRPGSKGKMSHSSSPTSSSSAASDIGVSLRRLFSVAGARRLAALAGLTISDALRSRVLLGMTVLVCLFGIGSLLWPADLESERVALVQRFCYTGLTLFGLIAAAFLGGSTLPKDISSKRIYSIATKPVSRLELLLGRTLGVFGVMFLFLFIGGLITFTVTHIASSRKTYKGGSYTAEVIAPTVDIMTKDGPVPVQQGQELPIDGEADGAYMVSIIGRESQVSGTIAKHAVDLHERSVAVERLVAPAEVIWQCRGEASFSHDELLLSCRELGSGDKWTFDVPPAPDATGDKDTVPVRLRFGRLLYEYLPYQGNRTGKTARVSFRFHGPNGEEVLKDIEFVVPERPSDQPPGDKRAHGQYEEVFVLPRSLVSGGVLKADVLNTVPEYAPTGRIYYGSVRFPTWRLRGFDAGKLPKRNQTIRATFLVFYTQGLDLIDHTEVTATVTNPATGESEERRLSLRNKTPTFIHFPRRLIDSKQGVEVTISGMAPTHRIGHSSKDSPLYLRLRPDWFWASAARSVFLLFLLLCLFTMIAVAASTMLSAPVAILLTLVAALASWVKMMIVQMRGAEGLVRPAGAATQQEAVWNWIQYLFGKLLVFAAPGMEKFSSSDFVKRGWSVPWPPVWDALAYTAVFVLVLFAVGFLLFRRRELE